MGAKWCRMCGKIFGMEYLGRIRKKGLSLNWSFWHNVVAIDSQRVVFIAEDDDKYLMCALGILETIGHMCWDCRICKESLGLGTCDETSF